MTQDKDQMRAEFEQWAATQADKWLLVGGLTWSPGTNDYASARTNAAWEAWQAARASAPQGVPATATKEMMRAAVIYANGADVYDKVPLAALEIEESIYGEAYAAMIAAAPQPVAQDMPVLYVSPEQLAEFKDKDATHGSYLPMRKAPAGKFTQPLYTSPCSIAGAGSKEGEPA